MKPILLRNVKVNDTVFVTGDPDRVKYLSKLLDDGTRAFDRRGYLVINGTRKGHEVTLASHGVGAPSASLIIEDLVANGAKTIIRLGTAGSLYEDLVEGEIVLADASGSITGSSTIRMYFREIQPPAAPDPLLLSRVYNLFLENNVKTHILPVFSSDALHAEEKYVKAIREAGYGLIDMETHTLYSLSRSRGYRALSILVISNNIVKKTPLKDSRELANVFEKIASILLDNLDKIKQTGS